MLFVEKNNHSWIYRSTLMSPLVSSSKNISGAIDSIQIPTLRDNVDQSTLTQSTGHHQHRGHHQHSCHTDRGKWKRRNENEQESVTPSVCDLIVWTDASVSHRDIHCLKTLPRLTSRSPSPTQGHLHLLAFGTQTEVAWLHHNGRTQSSVPFLSKFYAPHVTQNQYHIQRILRRTILCA